MVDPAFDRPGYTATIEEVKIAYDRWAADPTRRKILQALKMKNACSLGKEVGRIMAAGDLVPDGLIVDVVRSRLPDAEQGVGALLDGFPRTVAQARALDSMLSDEGHRVNFIVALDVPEKLLVDRLLHRAQVEGRTDDTREVIAERMREYHKLTEAVLDHYRKQGVRIHEVDGTGSPDQVFDRIHAAISGISSR